MDAATLGRAQILQQQFAAASVQYPGFIHALVESKEPDPLETALRILHLEGAAICAKWEYDRGVRRGAAFKTVHFLARDQRARWDRDTAMALMKRSAREWADIEWQLDRCINGSAIIVPPTEGDELGRWLVEVHRVLDFSILQRGSVGAIHFGKDSRLSLVAGAGFDVAVFYEAFEASAHAMAKLIGVPVATAIWQREHGTQSDDGVRGNHEGDASTTAAPTTVNGSAAVAAAGADERESPRVEDKQAASRLRWRLESIAAYYAELERVRAALDEVGFAEGEATDPPTLVLPEMERCAVPGLPDACETARELYASYATDIKAMAKSGLVCRAHGIGWAPPNSLDETDVLDRCNADLLAKLPAILRQTSPVVELVLYTWTDGQRDIWEKVPRLPPILRKEPEALDKAMDTVESWFADPIDVWEGAVDAWLEEVARRARQAIEERALGQGASRTLSDSELIGMGYVSTKEMVLRLGITGSGVRHRVRKGQLVCRKAKSGRLFFSPAEVKKHTPPKAGRGPVRAGKDIDPNEAAQYRSDVRTSNDGDHVS